MDISNNYFEISEETVAAWLDGNLPTEEESSFMDYLSNNDELAEILNSYDEIETSLEEIIDQGYELPADLAFDFELPEIGNPLFEEKIMADPIDMNSDNYYDDNLKVNHAIEDSYDMGENIDDSQDISGEEPDPSEIDFI